MWIPTAADPVTCRGPGSDLFFSAFFPIALELWTFYLPVNLTFGAGCGSSCFFLRGMASYIFFFFLCLYCN